MDSSRSESDLSDRVHIIREEIGNAETEAVLVLVEGLPYEYVTHDSSGGATTITLEKEDVDRIHEAVAQMTGGNVTEVIMETVVQPEPNSMKVEPSTSSETVPKECVHYFAVSSSKSCSLCLENVTVDPFYNISGDEILQNLCTCFGVMPIPKSEFKNELVLCTRCHTLLAEALDYLRTLERVQQMLLSTKEVLRQVLIKSSERGKDCSRKSQNLHSSVKNLRKLLLKSKFDLVSSYSNIFAEYIDLYWSEFLADVMKKSTDFPRSYKARNLKTARNMKQTIEKSKDPPVIVSANLQGGSSCTENRLRKRIQKPGYFRDMLTLRTRTQSKLNKTDARASGESDLATFTDLRSDVGEAESETGVPPKKRNKGIDQRGSGIVKINDNGKSSTRTDGKVASSTGNISSNFMRTRSERKRRKSPSPEQDDSYLEEAENVEHQEHNLSETTTENPRLAPCPYCDENFVADAKCASGDSTTPRCVKYACKILNCNRMFDSLQSLRHHHLRTCLKKPMCSDKPKSENKWECDKCSKSFATKVGLDHHRRTIHEKSFKFCCEVCGLGFQAINMLKRHVTFVHSTEKRYECKICHLRFKRSHQLLYHTRKHTGDLPFTCKTCGRGFVQPDKLTQHLAVHAEKQTPCPMCGKYFASKQYVTNHIRDTHLKVRQNKDCNRTKLRSKKAKSGIGQQTVNSKQNHDQISVPVSRIEEHVQEVSEEVVCMEYIEPFVEVSA